MPPDVPTGTRLSKTIKDRFRESCTIGILQCMIIADALDQVFKQLNQANVFYGHGFPSAWEETAGLVLHAMGLPQDSDDAVLEQTVSDVQWRQIEALLRRRIDERIPVAYLINEAWFMGQPYYVDERVLIPRSPFGEWIAKRFVPWIQPERVARICEIGTGSGCMAIACSQVFPETQIDACDISPDALAVARINVEQFGVESRVILHQSDVFSALEPNQQYDLIISNPPYVAQSEIDELPEEFHHEPASTALYAPNEGLAIVDRLLKESIHYLKPDGVLIVEVGYSDEILLHHYPSVPFTWLECEYGGQGLFLLTKQQLEDMYGRE